MNYSHKQENIDRYTLGRLRFLLNRAYSELETIGSALNSVSCAFFLVSSKGYVEFNNKYSALLLLKSSPKIGFIWDMLQDQELAQKIKESILAIKEMKNEVIEVSMPLQGISHLSCNLYPHIRDNKTDGWVVVINDFTEQYRLQELKKRSSYLQSVTNVTASIAHELKNPLGAISIHLQLIRKTFSKLADVQVNGQVYNSMNKSIGIIEEEIEGMNNIIGLFLNNLNIGRNEIKKYSLNEVLLATVDFITPDLKKHHITCQCNFDNLLPFVLISRPSVMHVILNIFKNAMEEMKGGGEIIIETFAKNAWVCIRISDTGPGIDKETQKTIFHPYFTTKETGTGVGLAIADKIMQLHHGSIQVDGNYKGGASFLLEFPSFADEQHLLVDKSIEQIEPEEMEKHSEL